MPLQRFLNRMMSNYESRTRDCSTTRFAVEILPMTFIITPRAIPNVNSRLINNNNKQDSHHEPIYCPMRTGLSCYRPAYDIFADTLTVLPTHSCVNIFCSRAWCLN